jgi:hypothetical protein
MAFKWWKEGEERLRHYLEEPQRHDTSSHLGGENGLGRRDGFSSGFALGVSPIPCMALGETRSFL